VSVVRRKESFFCHSSVFFPRHFLPCRDKELTSSSQQDHSTSEKHRSVHMRCLAIAATAADARSAATPGKSLTSGLDRSSRCPSRPPARLPRTGAEAASRRGRRAASPACAQQPPAAVARACAAHGGRGCGAHWGTAWLSCPQWPPAPAAAVRASAAHGGRGRGALWEAASPACLHLRCGARQRQSAIRSRDCHRGALWQARASIQTSGRQERVLNSTNRRT